MRANIYSITASTVPREGICVCGEHGQGRSRDDMDMSGAKKCGRLCRLSPPEVTLSLQVLQRTQTLRHGQPSLIVMFPHVARCVVNLLRWQSCLEWRPRVYLLWQGIFEGGNFSTGTLYPGSTDASGTAVGRIFAMVVRISSILQGFGIHGCPHCSTKRMLSGLNVSPVRKIIR
jgi:hypothetical protein